MNVLYPIHINWSPIDILVTPSTFVYFGTLTLIFLLLTTIFLNSTLHCCELLLFIETNYFYYAFGLPQDSTQYIYICFPFILFSFFIVLIQLKFLFYVLLIYFFILYYSLSVELHRRMQLKNKSCPNLIISTVCTCLFQNLYICVLINNHNAVYRP